MLLALAAEHRLILVGHAAAALGTGRRSAGARLARLSRVGLLASGQPLGDQRWYQATRAGLELTGRDLPAPAAVRPSAYEHDVGMAWVWLAAQKGAFGPVRSLLSEREMRSRDGRSRPAVGGPPLLGVPIHGLGPGGGERRHYPDLLVETTEGRRIAVELELSAKSRRAREQVLRAYGGQHGIDAVVYLTDRPGIGQAIAASARRLWVDDLLTVRAIAFGPGAGGLTPGRTGGLTRGPTGGLTSGRAGGLTRGRTGGRSAPVRAVPPPDHSPAQR
ncbi:MAG TPA: hypothetical protein VFN55_02505 [Solirubrobacteraceae bacterium]|nr:hypothetical protein [Solirubrobacteraceae bacterium]